MADPEEAGQYQIENQHTVQGQVVGSGNVVHQYFNSGSPKSTSPSHPASSVSSQRVWNIPFARNPFFTGRKDLLEQLHTHLQTTQAAAVSQPQAISGLGGIGKTQLAIEYAYCYDQEYQAVLWARAETVEALNASFTEIARLLDVPQKDAPEQEMIVQAVKSWLREKSGWLLILDNADELNILPSFLPPRYAGHLLLTTRAQITGKLARRLEVETLSSEVGALLLLRRAGVVAPDGALDSASSPDRAVAALLTEALGGLPLALDQAGAYIEETQCSLAGYYQQYQTQRAELLAHRGMLVDDHPEPVATTWSLSFAKVEQASPLAADLLRICAFLAPDAIPEELLVEALKTLPPPPGEAEPKDEEGGGFSRLSSGSRTRQPSPSLAETGAQIHEAVAILRAYSLLTRDAHAQTLTVHRLVQAVLRENMPPETQQGWMQLAISAVEAAYPGSDFVSWTACERLLPHVLLCAIWIEQTPNTSPTAASLLNEAGYYLHARGRYREAEPLLQRALAIREQELGANHPHTATSLNNLAGLYDAQGKYVEAEPLYERALAIWEQELGANHPHTATSLNNLALLYNAQGKYPEAEPLLQRALAICEQELGSHHPSTQIIRAHYVALLRQMKQNDATP